MLISERDVEKKERDINVIKRLAKNPTTAEP